MHSSYTHARAETGYGGLFQCKRLVGNFAGANRRIRPKREERRVTKTCTMKGTQLKMYGKGTISRKLLSAILLVSGLIAVAAGADFIATASPAYYSGPIHGVIIDANTNLPVEGALVLAQWVPISKGGGRAGAWGSVQSIEVLTDANGRYVVPGWGPRARRPGSKLGIFSPRLTILKRGYVSDQVHNVPSSATQGRTAPRSMWDGAQINLEPFRGDGRDEWRAYADVSDAAMDCNGNCPKFVATIREWDSSRP